jgi:hypothetical protein
VLSYEGAFRRWFWALEFHPRLTGQMGTQFANAVLFSFDSDGIKLLALVLCAVGIYSFAR